MSLTRTPQIHFLPETTSQAAENVQVHQAVLLDFL